MRNHHLNVAGNPQLLLDPEQRHIEPRAGQIGLCEGFANAKSINQDQRTIDFVCSTADLDRYGEIVEPSAFADSLDRFMRNPAFPAGHSYWFTNEKSPTVGHWKSMAITDAALVGTAWFKPRGLGEDCWLDYNDGNLTSVSVAFLTREWTMREIGEGQEKRRVRVFTKVDLLEVSAVLIPANAEARLRAAAFAARDAVGDLSDEQIQRAAKALEPLIVKTINESLSPDPGGPLAQLLMDVTGMQRGCGDHDDMRGNGVKSNDGLAEQLKRLAGQHA